MKRFLRALGYILLVVTAAFILLYAGVYFAVGRGWTKEEGQVDQNNYAYQQSYVESIHLRSAGPSQPANQNMITSVEVKNNCKLTALSAEYPNNTHAIKQAFSNTKSTELETRMIFALSLRNSDQTVKNLLEKCDTTTDSGQVLGAATETNNQVQNAYSWVNTEEWPIIRDAVTKDKDPILKAAAEADIEPRLLITPLIVEQLRLYFTEREYYKKFFKPLRILVNTNQMSWGVMAIKQNSAIAVENNLKDLSSPYYLGPKYEHLLDFKTADPATERYDRLTNESDHYYSYLYGALYMKQIMTQWSKAGYPVDARPEVICTLYNLGFEHSKPKSNPEVGGSEIEIDGTRYTFGGLGFEFYYSGEMTDIFRY